MKKTTKKWLAAAACLVVLGLIIVAGIMAAYDWDFTKLSTVRYETNTYKIQDRFDNISIHADTADLQIVPTDDGHCSIVCFEEEKAKHSAAVENGTLVIRTVDTRKWYEHIGIFLATPKVTVYLPQDAYASLSIESDTGNITIRKGLSFENLKINAYTSDVDSFASVSNALEIALSTGSIQVGNLATGQLTLTTTTGNMKVTSCTAKDNIVINTDTGSVQLADISCADFLAESDTGTISLKNVIATGNISIENDTGNVRFENSDAAGISVQTSTGDVTGTLLSQKVFVTDTSTGDVHVPSTGTGGRCEIRTATGDIKIDIQP